MRVCQDVRKHKSTVTRGYARSMSGLFRHFPLSRSPLFLPHPNPNFLNPFNWGGHLIETGMWQLCQPCFKCKQSESRHLHTGEGHWNIWHIIHSTPSFPCFLMSLSSVLLSCPSWQYQFAWCSSFERCFLWLSVTCRRFHRTHSAFVIGPQLFPVSSACRESWQEPRVKCSVKTRYGEIENKFTSSMLLLRYGVTTKASEELIMEARKQNCDSQQPKVEEHFSEKRN